MSICIADENGTVKVCAGKPFSCIRGPQDGITGKVCQNEMPDDDHILDFEGEYREDIVWADPNANNEEGKPVLHEYRLLDEKTGTYIYSGVVNG